MHPSRKILVGVAVLALTVGIAALLASPHRPINRGFGPEWKCDSTIMRGPVCFKDLGAAPLLHSN